MTKTRLALPVALAAAIGLSGLAPLTASAAPVGAPAAAPAPAEVAVPPSSMRTWPRQLITGVNATRRASKKSRLAPSNCLSKAAVPITNRLSRQGGKKFSLTKAEVRSLGACTAAGKNPSWKYGFVWGHGFANPPTLLKAMRNDTSSRNILLRPEFTQIGASTAVGPRGVPWALVVMVE